MHRVKGVLHVLLSAINGMTLYNVEHHLTDLSMLANRLGLNHVIVAEYL